MTFLFVVSDVDAWHHATAIVASKGDQWEKALVLCPVGTSPVPGAHMYYATCNHEELDYIISDIVRRYAVSVALVTTKRSGSDIFTRAVSAALGSNRTLVLQEYWGDRIEQIDDAPTSYLVRDELALRMTEPTVEESIYIIGSPKYARFESVDLLNARLAARRCLTIDDSQRVIGWFGQAPAVSAAYARTLEALVATIRKMPATVVLYKPHERETEAQIRATVGLFSREGIQTRRLANGDLLSCLLAADIVASCFSNCGADAVHLNRIAPRPINTTIYLLFDEELRDYHRQHTNLEIPPYAIRGLANCVTDRNALEPMLDESMQEAALKCAWAAARSKVTPGSIAAAVAASRMEDMEFRLLK